MKTTTTVLSATLSVLATYLAGFVLLNISMPMIVFFEYGVGTVVAIGILAMAGIRPRKILRKTDVNCSTTTEYARGLSRWSHYRLRHNLPHAA